MDYLSTRNEADELWRTCEQEVRAIVRKALRKWPRHLQGDDSVEEVVCRVGQSLTEALVKTGRGRVYSDPGQGCRWLLTVARCAAIAYALERVNEDARKVAIPDNGEIAAIGRAPSIEDEIVEACHAAERRRLWHAIKPIVVRELTAKQRACVFARLNPGGIEAVARRFSISRNHVCVCANHTRLKIGRLAPSLL
jgi:hypothetical protein